MMGFTPIECKHADVGVMVVHGIGNQDAEETKNKYGQAIADVWDQFGGRRQGFTQIRCTEGHIHLTRPDGSHAALIDEGRWNQIDPEPPSVWKLLIWLLVVAPWALMYSALRPPRSDKEKNHLQAIVHFGIGAFVWFCRAIIVPLLVPFVLALIIVTVTLLAIAHHGDAMLTRSDASDEDAGAATKLLGMAGDAFRFSQATHSAPKYADAVSIKAHQLQALTSRLLVVAHSQGGAVTYEAIVGRSRTAQFGRTVMWPSTPTQVVTLGSGHNRLMLLRRMLVGTRSRLFSGLGALGIIVATSLVWVESESGWEVGVFYGAAFLVGSILLTLAWLNGRHIGATLRARGVNWTDIWATRDLVPDGPLPFSGIPSIRVTNTHNPLGDHTSYDKNLEGVTSRLVDAIDPTRLMHDQAVVRELRLARCRRYRKTHAFASDITAGLATFVPGARNRRVIADVQRRLPSPAPQPAARKRALGFMSSRSTVVQF